MEICGFGRSPVKRRRPKPVKPSNDAKPPPPTLESLDRLAYLVREAVLTTHRVDSCVATCRAMVDACATLGWTARPLPCVLSAINQALRTRLEDRASRGLLAASVEEYDAWAAEGAYMVHVGKDPDGEHDVGHLVVVVEDRFLVDASIDQASRPRKGIDLSRPFVALYDGRSDAAFTRGDGVTLVYERTPLNRRYRRSPDWSDRTRTERAVATAVGAFRREYVIVPIGKRERVVAYERTDTKTRRTRG